MSAALQGSGGEQRCQPPSGGSTSVILDADLGEEEYARTRGWDLATRCRSCFRQRPAATASGWASRVCTSCSFLIPRSGATMRSTGAVSAIWSRSAWGHLWMSNMSVAWPDRGDDQFAVSRTSTVMAIVEAIAP